MATGFIDASFINHLQKTLLSALPLRTPKKYLSA
jgi:hypothetical protein